MRNVPGGDTGASGPADLEGTSSSYKPIMKVANLSQNNAVRFDDQFSAIDGGAIEVENNEFH
jgi:hypothetical protein